MKKIYVALLLFISALGFSKDHASTAYWGNENRGQILSSSTAATLTLTYPNGDNILEAGKTQRITWESSEINTTVSIEFSRNNGGTWNTVATTSADLGYYDLKVPNQISNTCLIRISGGGLSDTSNGTFSIIKDEDVVYRIVVLGSSTAEGVGPDDINDSWVNRYKTYLNQKDTRFEVINLGKGGYSTYDILPTGTPIKDGVNRSIDTQRNVTKALSYNPGGIIINMPSNDAAYGYPAEDQMDNYDVISEKIADAEIPLWVTSVQPKDFGTNTTKKNIQLEMLQAVEEKFGNMTIDFWTGLGQNDNNGILEQYDSGDGTHMNAAGHLVLFNRVVDKDIDDRVKSDIDLSIDDELTTKGSFVIYPNPVNDRCTIQLEKQANGDAMITVYDLLGKTVYSAVTPLQNGRATWSKGTLKAGIYILQVSYNEKINAQRLLIH